jgi:hypothetical protein
MRNNAMLRKPLLSFLFALSLAIWVAPVAALTPDGEPPSVETFCDDNFAGRLRGLCNAFCEAMDCDSLDAKASMKACITIEGKIAPLLAAHNIEFGTDLEISAADAVLQTEGQCGQQAGNECTGQPDGTPCNTAPYGGSNMCMGEMCI